MEAILERVRSWAAAGEDVVVATIVDVERKAPRGAGASMAVSGRGEIAGSLSGGCVEPAVVESAREVLARGEPRLVRFGISDDEALGVGLSCGGTLHVFVEPADRAALDALGEAVSSGRAVALATVLDAGGRPGVAPGAKLLVPEQGEPRGGTGDSALDREVVDAAREALGRDEPRRRRFGETDVFLRPFCPPAVVYVVGAVHPAAELCRAARLLGYRVVVCDPRSPFATPERLPDADEIVREWPDAFLERVRPGPRDAVCVLTHDLKFDVPAIRTALDCGAGYVGAMGSRRTHARRVERLREDGVSEEALARVSAPIGLDIGAKSPSEIAVSIVADIVGRRRLGT